MSPSYFHRVAQKTQTRLWINNASAREIELAIDAGAINMTSNPSYSSKLIKKEPDHMSALLGRAVARTEDDEEAAQLVIREVSERALDMFLPLFEESGGTYGYVTVQDDPRRDDDADAIVHEALKFQKLRPNFMAKIPVTVAGLKAMEALVPHEVPICATEVFSVSQAFRMCTLYERASQKSGKQPPFFVTHITGIYDEYLQKDVESKGVDIAPEALAEAGCVVARKEYRLLKERGFRTTLLSGGARKPRHFTEMVGGDVHVTINWDMAERLIEADGPVVLRMDAQTPAPVIQELCDKVTDFRRAYVDDALAPEEFADFGGVRYFRDMFLAGYAHLLKEIAARR